MRVHLAINLRPGRFSITKIVHLLRLERPSRMGGHRLLARGKFRPRRRRRVAGDKGRP